MTDFFIADMHFGSPYKSYAKPRGFASVEDMHTAICDAWRARVGADDTVWIIGDVGDLEPLQALPGKKHLIYGNDDRPRRPFKESGLFETLTDAHVMETEWSPILLVHRPKDARPEIPVIHGHTHANPDEVDPRFVSVSVDKTGWGPISLDEVTQRFRTRALEGAAA